MTCNDCGKTYEPIVGGPIDWCLDCAAKFHKEMEGRFELSKAMLGKDSGRSTPKEVETLLKASDDLHNRKTC